MGGKRAYKGRPCKDRSPRHSGHSIACAKTLHRPERASIEEFVVREEAHRLGAEPARKLIKRAHYRDRRLPFCKYHFVNQTIEVNETMEDSVFYGGVWPQFGLSF
jgi:hypothetical protein